MGYLRDMYGTRSPDFIRGFLACMELYAIWKDGKRYIGVMEEPLRSAMQDAVNELAEKPEDFKKDIRGAQ